MFKSKATFGWVLSALLGTGGALILSCAPSFWVRSPQSVAAPLSRCPVLELSESAEDCPWAGWVREVEGGRLQSSDLPEPVRTSLERDRRDTALQEAWGRSQNWDEGARAEIVSRPILKALAESFGVQVESRADRLLVHAGVIHTYGYLLSNLKTPFGYKRARWVSGRLERGLGLPEGSLSPAAMNFSPEASLLAQVTYLLMKVAHREDSASWQGSWQARLEPRVTPELRGLELPGATRRSEIQVLSSGEQVEWVTHLLELPRDSRGGRLLVYSQKTKAGVRVITGFPVEKDFVERKKDPVRPRYNAWVD